MPALAEYDDRQAAVSQALGMEPSAWQVGGRAEGEEWRMGDLRFYWGIFEAEGDARRFVDQEVGSHSHMICAQYPELNDAWALEAMKAAMRQGLEMSLSRIVGAWSAQVWRGGKLQGGSADRSAGVAVRDALYFCLKLHRAA